MKARIELYKDGDHLAILTNAANEDDFYEAFCELLSNLIDADKYSGDWEFQFRFWLPQATDIVCRLRGYKNDVHEERVMVAGHIGPMRTAKVAEIGPETSGESVPLDDEEVETVA
jgi:hypothetical protein